MRRGNFSSQVGFFLFSVFPLVFVVGCGNPRDRILNPAVELAFPANVSEMKIYEDEIRTGGGVMLYSSADNQILDFAFREDDVNRSIRYSWNGGRVLDYTYDVYQHSWCGFGFIVGGDYTAINTFRNLSSYNFTTLRFRIRGHLSPGTSIRITGPTGRSATTGNSEEITSLTQEWQEFEVPLTVDLSETNIYLGVVFVYSGTVQGMGGEVFIDDIKLVR